MITHNYQMFQLASPILSSWLSGLTTSHVRAEHDWLQIGI